MNKCPEGHIVNLCRRLRYFDLQGRNSLQRAVIFIMTQSKKTLRKRRLFCTLWSGLGIFLDIVWGGNVLINTKTGQTRSEHIYHSPKNDDSDKREYTV